MFFKKIKAKIKSIMISGAIPKNNQRHEWLDTTNPDSVGPMVGAKFNANPIIPIAWPRRSAANRFITTTFINGPKTPAPAAWIIRPIIKMGYDGANPATKVPTANTNTALKYNVRVLRRWIKKAVSGTITPFTNMYPFVIHWPRAVEMWKSAMTCGKAVFINVWFKNPKKTPAIKMIKTPRSFLLIPSI